VGATPEKSGRPRFSENIAPTAPAAPSPADPRAGVKPPVVDSSSITSSTSAAVKPPVAVKADKPELTYEEQRLVSKGYKLNMRNGEKWFCRRELGLGLRVAAQNVCGTASMLLQSRTDQQNDLRDVQKKLITVPRHSLAGFPRGRGSGSR
jgi:hypothetical protein